MVGFGRHPRAEATFQKLATHVEFVAETVWDEYYAENDPRYQAAQHKPQKAEVFQVRGSRDASQVQITIQRGED